MKHRSLVHGVRLALALSFLVASSALAEPDKVMRGPTSTTADVKDGKPGYWVEYTEYTYRNYDAHIRSLCADAGLPEADIQALLGYFHGLSTAPTDDQIKARIAQILADRSRDAIIARWRATYGEMDPGTYSSAGSYAYELAKMLRDGGYSVAGDPVNFADNSWGDTERGWPLQAAMIHEGDYNTGESFTQGTWLAAWDIVWANVDAHGWQLEDPIVLDLNGNGRIDVTGLSSAKFRAKSQQRFVKAGSVMFDLLGTRHPVRTEWIRPGEGLLVDNRKGAALKLVKAGKNLSILDLFGDRDGYAGGFLKLAHEFGAKTQVASTRISLSPGSMVLQGAALKDLLVWVDNGDGVAKPNELHALSELGITELKIPAKFVQTANHEVLEQATFVRHGQPALMQEVWFAREAPSQK